MLLFLLICKVPKIRTGEILNNGVELIEQSEVIITTDKMIGTADRFSINYAQLPQDVKAGEKILLDDGKFIPRNT